MSIALAPQVPSTAVDSYNYLIKQGLSPAQASGVVGNLITESGVDPNSGNPQEGAIGIGQWEGPRRTNLQQFAAQIGQPMNSLSTQLAFLWSELTGSESGALTALKATNTPADAAYVFASQYERCWQCAGGGGSVPKRQNNANNIYALMTGSNPPQGSGNAILTSASTSSSKANCAIGWTWPSAGPLGGGDICIWHNSWTRALFGGLLIGAGGLISVYGLGLLTGRELVTGVAGRTISNALNRRR